MSELVGAAIGSVATAASSVGWFVPMLVAAIAYFQYEEFMDPEARVIDVPTEVMLDKYDFIIIGAGSAGAVLANRLTEVENWNVLLLEAGGDETEISEVPLMAGYLQLSKLDWKYKSEPSGTFCLGWCHSARIV
uniref:Glucose-methanol-choline oxidoreductase N-terminal domain-containing protein n=1 Tax=Anopheles atroparvus TaxID=41427 RepID=A0AAG5CRJ4_ANOAO